MAVKGTIAGTAAQRTAYDTALLSTGQWWAQISTDNVPILEGYYFWTGNAWTANDDVGDLPQTFIESTYYPSLKTTRVSAQITTSANAFQVKHKTSGNMADGFGAAMRFTIEDSAEIANDIGSIYVERSGADNSGRMVFGVTTAGAMNEVASIAKDGALNIAGELNLAGNIGNGYVLMKEITAPSNAPTNKAFLF